ncbi:hypothetical protein JOB18_026188 [Solea senegalensis]|uniref:Uncharacterized protein n=1 Tax=Solea senegalensis TaxID=28829 RepID=A0AAV6T7I3_SOLSE|nr:hypothetical protein JOB18_026188 [Solea senegalensis]
MGGTASLRSSLFNDNVPNLGILKTLSICYYRIATEQEKDRKEEKRNALYQRAEAEAEVTALEGEESPC